MAKIEVGPPGSPGYREAFNEITDKVTDLFEWAQERFEDSNELYSLLARTMLVSVATLVIEGQEEPARAWERMTGLSFHEALQASRAYKATQDKDRN